LQPAVVPFRTILYSYEFQAPAIPVYLCTENVAYSKDNDLASALSQQLVKRLDFASILGHLHERGFRRFIECGAGNIVTKLALESGLEGISARAAAPQPAGAHRGIAEVLDEFGSNRCSSAGLTPALSDVAREMRAIIERASRVLDALSAATVPVQTKSDQSAPESSEFNGDVERCEAEPVAIVALGCVLPGAHNAEQYWSNVLHGVSGITDLGKEDLTAVTD